MSKKNSISRSRAWAVLRLALLWARKGGVFRNRLVINLNVLQRGIRKLRHGHQTPRGALVYGDRELSFDDTPIIHVKMHRPSSLRFKMPHIPCIKPQVDFDYDFEFDDDDEDEMHEGVDRAKGMASSFKVAEEDQEEEEEDDDEVNGAYDEGIDSKAEQFIAKFYEQMKLQRQISYLQYNEKGSS